MSADRNKLIVVLGMHRSGTSVITRSLQVLGVGLGQNLYPPADDNPTGFWEDRDCLSINEALLSQLGSDYDRLGLAWNFDVNNPSVGYLYSSAVELVSRSIANNQGLWGVKDPRMCRLLGFWKKVFDACHCKVHYVISLRNPKSVAESLKKRNDIPLEKGYLLWLQHMVPAVLDTQGSLRIVVNYDTLVDNPLAEVTRIANNLNLPLDTQNSALMQDFLDKFLDDNLRHSRYSFSDVVEGDCLPPDVFKAYDWLLRVGNDDISLDSDMVQLGFKQIRSNLEAYASVFEYANRLEDEVVALTKSEKALSIQVVNKEKSRQALAKNLNKIVFSNEWRISLMLRRLQFFFLPPESWQLRLATKIFPSLLSFYYSHVSKVQRDWELIRKSGFFDPAQYIAGNPDIAADEIDPILHYLIRGGFEGRNPSEKFSSQWYLETYSDTQAAGMNPLVHYLQYGKHEGRSPRPQKD